MTKPLVITKQIRKLIKDALQEDAAQYDVTTRACVPSSARATAKIIACSTGIVAGLPLVRAVFHAFDPTVRVTFTAREGQKVRKGKNVCSIQGKAQSILTAERVALNFLSRLSGIATVTRALVERVRPYGVDIYDTRKTTPLHRTLERYAVRVGGGKNHRFHLAAQALVKDNHLALLKQQPFGLRAATRRLRKQHVPIEIEVDQLADLQEALIVRPDIILLDNFSPQQLRRAVKQVKAFYTASCQGKKAQPLIEASGGFTVRDVRAVARTGVDRISVGALTHSATWLNYSLEIHTA